MQTHGDGVEFRVPVDVHVCHVDEQRQQTVEEGQHADRHEELSRRGHILHQAGLRHRVVTEGPIGFHQQHLVQPGECV